MFVYQKNALFEVRVLVKQPHSVVRFVGNITCINVLLDARMHLYLSHRKIASIGTLKLLEKKFIYNFNRQTKNRIIFLITEKRLNSWSGFDFIN